MAVALADLVTRIQADIPQQNSIPTDDQYEQAILSAVADYGARRPLRRSYTLPVAAGTATYAMPDDFLALIELPPLATAENDVIAGATLIPTAGMYGRQERVWVEHQALTISPTPQYTLDRILWYAAAHELDDNSEYPYMTAADVELVMLRAQAILLNLLANQGALQAWSYRLGDESVDKRGIAAALRAQAADLQAQYEQAVATAVGPVILVQTYAE